MGQKHSVLIFDSNPEDLMPLICFMEDRYDPIVAPEKTDCMSFAEKSSPDIILVDDMLSDPNCYEACQDLKGVPGMGDVPIVLMSDLSVEELTEEIAYLGVDDYICKPIDKDELLKKIDTLLSFRQAH
jgi:cyclic di-GMP phosphodiesterase